MFFRANRCAALLVLSVAFFSGESVRGDTPCDSRTLGQWLRSGLSSLFSPGARTAPKTARRSLDKVPDFLETNRVGAPEWDRLFVRFPEAQDLTSAYARTLISNSTDSLRAFDLWFRGESTGNFLSMLREQHRILMEGGQGAGGAYGGFHRGNSWELHKVRPGVLVSEGSVRDFTKRFPGTPVSLDVNPERLAGKSSVFPTEIEGIPPESWPSNERMGLRKYRHLYPKVQDHYYYERRMGELMRAIRAEFVQAADSRLLELLADYYHVAINGHPFYRGNNSLFMGQVNYILQMMGYQGMVHGNLDFEALSSSTREFRGIFREAVHREQRR